VSHGIHFLVAVLYAGSCFGIGSLLLKLFRVNKVLRDTETGATRAVSGFLLGSGVFANLWLLLALHGHLTRAVIGAVSLAGIVCAIVTLVTERYCLVPALRVWWRDLSALQVSWKAIAAIVGIYIVLVAAWVLLYPPSGDALAFYMVLPKVMAASHRLLPLSGYEDFTQIGLFGECHYAALMSIWSPAAAKMFGLITGMCGLFMLCRIGRLAGGGIKTGILACAVFISSTAVLLVMTDGKVDIFGTALGLSAYYWALRSAAVDKKGIAALCLAGLFMGFSLVAKVSFIPALAPGIILIIVWQQWATCGRKVSVTLVRSCCAGVALLLLCVVIPWISQWIKNTQLFSNPLLPFVGAANGSVFSQTWFSPDVTLRILLTYPFALTFGRYPMQGGDFSPLLLLLLPLALLLPKPKQWASSTLFRITAAALLGTIIFVALRPSVFAPRYLMATLLLFVPLAACAAEYVCNAEPSRRWLKRGVVFGTISVLLISLGVKAGIGAQCLRVLRGTTTSEQLDGARFRAEESLNKAAVPGDRIYVAGYYRYWLRPDLIQAGSTTAEVKEMSTLSSPEARWDFLQKRGFSFLLVDRETHAKSEPLFATTRVPAGMRTAALFNEGNYLVCRIQSADH
jgi:hypothetical protein